MDIGFILAVAGCGVMVATLGWVFTEWVRYRIEKYQWNDGVCRLTGEPWELVEVQEERRLRVYQSEYPFILTVSYPGVDGHGAVRDGRVQGHFECSRYSGDVV